MSTPRNTSNKPPRRQGPHHPGHPPQREHRYRRQKANPATLFLGLVGVALIIGILIIAGGGSPKVLKDRKNSDPKQDLKALEAQLTAKVYQLDNFSGSLQEGRKLAQQIYMEASDFPMIQEKTLKVIKNYNIQEAKLVHQAFLKLKPTVILLAEKGEFREAHSKVAGFRKQHDMVLSKKLDIVKLITKAADNLGEEIDLIRKQFSGEKLKLLTAAIKADDFDAANTLYGDIKSKGTEAEQSLADKIWDAYFSEKVKVDRASLAQNQEKEKSLAQLWKERQKNRSDGENTGSDDPLPGSGDIVQGGDAGDNMPAPAPEPIDPGDDFFGDPKDDDTFTDPTEGADPAVDAGTGGGQDTSVYAALKKDQDHGYWTVIIKGQKTRVIVNADTKVRLDQPISEKKYVEDMKPQTRVLFLARSRDLQWRGRERQSDPAQGMRISDAQLLIYGDGVPLRSLWNDVKNPQLQWFAGLYVPRRTPPAMFDLNGKRYLILGAPRYIVKRTILNHTALRAGLVFIQGKVNGLEDKDTPNTLKAEDITFIPQTAVSKTPYYLSLLKEPVF